MVAPWHLLADAPLDKARQLWRQNFVWAALVIVAALLLAAAVLAWVRRWSKQPGEDAPGAGDQLAHFRTLYERGELSTEEFERLRGTLSERLRREMDVPGPSAGGGPPPSTPPADRPTPGR